MTGLYQFLSGMAMLGAWVGGVFFFKFWFKSRDRLFLIFGLAFWFLALERVILALMVDPRQGEDYSDVYLIRLVAFLLIGFAIVDKNRADRRPPNSR